MNDIKGQRVHFVTGKLAAESLRRLVEQLAAELSFRPSIEVLPISVAALMTTEWIAKKWNPPSNVDRVILPGYCIGDLTDLQHAPSAHCEKGPRDLRGLAKFLGGQPLPSDYGRHNIEIIAEINHAPRLSRTELVAEATELARDGADVIDIGCDPGTEWTGVGDAVQAVRDQGLRVSIDSFHPQEIQQAVEAGAELVLSVNGSNLQHAASWGCEVVVIPDTPQDLDSLFRNIEQLSDQNIPYRIDPILEPIGCGFAASLKRYFDVRNAFPGDAMMMGIGNLTELTDCDSAGINTLLIAICQELKIQSVLTTQVINWARTSVRECDVARRLAYHAIEHSTVPKHVDDRLIMLRDTEVLPPSDRQLSEMASQIRDNNFRVFAEGDALHLISRQFHEQDCDPFVLFQKVLDERPESVDSSHAFYLGYELAKAATALALGKQYRQDEALDWGMQTVPEDSHRLRRTSAARGGSHGQP